MSCCPEPATVITRRAVRAILLTDDARILPIHAREPVTGAMLWLAFFLGRLVATGPPAEPIDVGA